MTSRMARLIRTMSDVANARLMWVAISSRLEFGPMTGLMRFADINLPSKEDRFCSTILRDDRTGELIVEADAPSYHGLATAEHSYSYRRGDRIALRLLRCTSPLLPRNGPPAKSAVWSLTGVNRTCGGRPNSVAIDPTRTFVGSPAFAVRLFNLKYLRWRHHSSGTIKACAVHPDIPS